jgi:thioredoxin 1
MVRPVNDDAAARRGRRGLRRRLTIAKINVDENKSVLGKYNVRGIPAMILFKDGPNAPGWSA